MSDAIPSRPAIFMTDAAIEREDNFVEQFCDELNTTGDPADCRCGTIRIAYQHGQDDALRAIEEPRVAPIPPGRSEDTR